MTHKTQFFLLSIMVASWLVTACDDSNKNTSNDFESDNHGDTTDGVTTGHIEGTGLLAAPCQFAYAPSQISNDEVSYNENGLPLKQTFMPGSPSSNTYETNYTYDSQNRLTEYRTVSSDPEYKYHISYEYNEDSPLPVRRIVNDDPTVVVVVIDEYTYVENRLHSIVSGRGVSDSEIDVERYKIENYIYDADGRLIEKITSKIVPNIVGTLDTSNMPDEDELEALKQPFERQLFTYDDDEQLIKQQEFAPRNHHLFTYDDGGELIMLQDITPEDQWWKEFAYTDFHWDNNRLESMYYYHGDLELPVEKRSYSSISTEFSFTKAGRLESQHITSNSTYVDEDGFAEVSPEKTRSKSFTYTDAGNSCLFEYFRGEGFYFPNRLMDIPVLYGQGNSTLFANN